MSSFLIVHITIKDPEKLKTYISSAGATLAEFGAEILTKGKVINTLVGEHNGHSAAVIKFPDQAAIDVWYNSANYQALIPNRDEAADMVFISYDEPPVN